MARRIGAKTTAEMVEHLLAEADALRKQIQVPDDNGLNRLEDPLAFIGSIGVPLVDWALAETTYHEKNDAQRIALETMRGTMLGIAETY